MHDAELKLGVNVDHVATLRQARGTEYPSVLDAALACEAVGALGITVHLREDRRHIQDADVRTLRERISTRLNLEMANSAEIVSIALDVLPHEACLVPEKREELTTEGGLDVAGQVDLVGETVRRLAGAGIVVSLFIDAERTQIEAAVEIGATTIELHTGRYCDLQGTEAERELDRLVEGAVYARELGLAVNAGHGINLANIEGILDIPFLDTLNIGHSIVARAVFAGINQSVREMLDCMARYRGGRKPAAG